VALALAGALLAGCSMRALIYPVPAVPVGPPPAGYEEVRLELADGVEIHGWASPSSSADRRPALLYLHGNAENLETLRMSGILELLERLGVRLLAIDYPGYGRSGGRPSEASLAAAAEAALDELGRRFPAGPRVVFGWSLGAAVAARLAASRPSQVDGLVLASAWSSLLDVAATLYPAWLVRMVLRERWSSIEAAAAIDAPSLVLHGLDDRIIPARQGERVAAALGPAAEWVPLAGSGHNDLLGHPRVWLEVGRFIERLETPESR
jgi:pimeloyl-ACP methyl ester carboxylesterase